MNVGTVLAGRYRIERLLGRGGMGAVYEATHLDLSRKVAIKLLDAAADASHEAIVATEREARAAAQLAHPHIIQVTDFSPGESGPPFLVMELLHGESLDERLGRVRKLDPEAAAFILVQVLSALGAAHASGIVHRDVKPANIFLTSTAATHDFVKLLDFGVAWSMSAVASRRGESFAAGTPAYMAPEQVAGETLDARTDLWAVGVVLYEMLSARTPFQAESVPALLVKVCDAKPAPLDTVASDVPPGLARIVARAMQKDMSLRFQSAEEMRLALAPFARSAAVPSTAIGAPRAQRILEQAETVRQPSNDDATMPGVSPPETERHEQVSSPLVTPASNDSTRTRRSAPSDGGASHATLASSPQVTRELATTAPAARPLTRPFGPLIVVAVALASIVGGAQLLGSSSRSASRPTSTAAAAPTACQLGRVLPPWPVGDAEIALAVGKDAVLVSANERKGAPRYASARTSDDALVEWANLMFPDLRDVEPRACATTIGDGVAGVAMWPRPRMPGRLRGVFMVFNQPVSDGGLEHFPRAIQALSHVSKELRCASAETMTVLTSRGDEYEIAPGSPQDHAMPDTLRLILMDGPRVESTAVGVPVLRDLRVAASPELVSVSVTTNTHLKLAMLDPRARTLSVDLASSAEGSDIAESTMAIVRSEVQLAWVQSAPRRIEWASYTRTRGHSAGVLLEGDVFSPALAARGEDVVLAFGRREEGRTSIYVGSGKTTVEAARSAASISVPGDAKQIRLARGNSPAEPPWIAWVEGTGDARAVRVASVRCP